MRGDALCWLASYLTDRTQCVNVDGHLSCNIQLRHGVPQGSVLGPLLFSVYCAGLSEVFSKHGIRYHVYADDTQLYVDFPRNDAASAADRISRCVIDVKVWLGIALPTFKRDEDRGGTVLSTEQPCSTATSSSHRHLRM